MEELFPEEFFLNVKEVARILRLSRQEVYRMVAKKQIPFTRIKPRGIRFLREDFERWFRSLTLKPENVLSTPIRLKAKAVGNSENDSIKGKTTEVEFSNSIQIEN